MSSAVKNTLRKRVSTARTERGWSQRELGRQAGVSNAFVSQLESGASDNLRLSTILALAKALETKVGWMLGEEG